MKLFLKILLFVFVALIANVNATSASITFPNIQEATTSFSFQNETPKTIYNLIENNLADCCQNGQDLVDYRNRGTGFEVNAAKGGTQAVEGIYEFTAASGKTYIGQSGNIAARLEQHIASGKLLPGTSVKTTEVLGGKTAREIAEQLRINSLGGIKNLENIRNPIGPARQHLLPK